MASTISRLFSVHTLDKIRRAPLRSSSIKSQLPLLANETKYRLEKDMAIMLSIFSSGVAKKLKPDLKIITAKLLSHYGEGKKENFKSWLHVSFKKSQKYRKHVRCMHVSLECILNLLAFALISFIFKL